MFRFRQSQILPQELNGLLSRFKAEDTRKTVKIKHSTPQVITMDSATSPFKRRRRARRLAGVSGTYNLVLG
jgi:hypothetical protein